VGYVIGTKRWGSDQHEYGEFGASEGNDAAYDVDAPGIVP